MPDEMRATHFEARALLAAALITSKVVDVSVVYFGDPVAAASAPSVVSLKQAVDVLMNAVVYK
jgi:hypothetical protein